MTTYLLRRAGTSLPRFRRCLHRSFALFSAFVFSLVQSPVHGETLLPITLIEQLTEETLYLQWDGGEFPIYDIEYATTLGEDANWERIFRTAREDLEVPILVPERQFLRVVAPKDEFVTIEFTVFPDSGDPTTWRLLPRLPGDDWVFESVVSNPDLGIDQVNRLVIPDAEFSKVDVDFERLSPEFELLESATGDPTGVGGIMDILEGPGPDDLTFVGEIFYPSADGADLQSAAYELVTDPAGTTIVAVCIIGAALCFAGFVITDCQDSRATLNAIEACRENGGLPCLNVTSNVGIQLSPFKIGCFYNCSVECKPNA